MSAAAETVFLLDVDNTLARQRPGHTGPETAHHQGLWGRSPASLLGHLRGHAQGAGLRRLSRRPAAHRIETCAIRSSCRSASSTDYPFANRLFPGSMDAIEHLGQWGPTVILSDGDVVFQPRKVFRSGLFEAVEGHVLIYIHKEQELDDVERFPARHYVLVDDKPRILSGEKAIWGSGSRRCFRRRAITLRRSRRATGRPLISRSTGSAICWAMIYRS